MKDNFAPRRRSCLPCLARGALWSDAFHAQTECARRSCLPKRGACVATGVQTAAPLGISGIGCGQRAHACPYGARSGRVLRDHPRHGPTQRTRQARMGVDRVVPRNGDRVGELRQRPVRHRPPAQRAPTAAGAAVPSRSPRLHVAYHGPHHATTARIVSLLRSPSVPVSSLRCDTGICPSSTRGRGWRRQYRVTQDRAVACGHSPFRSRRDESFAPPNTTVLVSCRGLDDGGGAGRLDSVCPSAVRAALQESLAGSTPEPQSDRRQRVGEVPGWALLGSDQRDVRGVLWGGKPRTVLRSTARGTPGRAWRDVATQATSGPRSGRTPPPP